MTLDASRMRITQALTFLLCIVALPALAADRPRGLPTGPGQPCVLDLIKKELPRGYVPDDFACQNQDGEVHQWIMRGNDRMDRVEINISQWGPPAEKYMQWKQGMIWTKTHELVPTKLGTQSMYYEANGDCNKQLMMRVGSYFVEIHRPPKEGVSQQADPIDRASFLKIVDAVVARITEENDVPKSGWGGKLIRREIVGASQTPAYGPAAGPRFDAGHFTIKPGEKAESFEVVSGNSDVGAIYYWDSTKRHVFQRIDDWAGLNGLELGPGRYALSCNYMDKGIGAGGMGSLRIVFDVVSGFVEPPPGGGGMSQPIDNDPSKPPPAFVTEPVITPEPVEIETDYYSLPSPETTGIPSTQGISTYGFYPGAETYVQGTATRLYVWRRGPTGAWVEDTGAVHWLAKGEAIGHFEGNTFHAEAPGYCWVSYTCPGTRTNFVTGKVSPCRLHKTVLFRVVPGPSKPIPRMPWSTSPEQILKGKVYLGDPASSRPIKGVRVTLQSDYNGGTVDPASSDADGMYGFTGRQLGLLPPGKYELRACKPSAQLGQDLWHAEDQIVVTLPITGVLKRDIELERASTKFKKQGVIIPLATESAPSGTEASPKPDVKPTDTQGAGQVSTCTETGLRATGRCPDTVDRTFAADAEPGPCTTHTRAPKLVVLAPSDGDTVEEQFGINGTCVPGRKVRVTVVAEATLKATGQNAKTKLLEDATARVGDDGKWSINVNARAVCRDKRVDLKQFSITVYMRKNLKIAEQIDFTVRP